MLVEKEVIRPGQYWYRDEATGQPRKLTVTPELTRYWGEQGNAMLSSGLTVPVPFEHDFDAHPMTPADKLKNNSGWVKNYFLKEVQNKDGSRAEALFSAVDIEDPEVANKLPKTIRWTSPWINSFTDGNGKEWKNVISHLALTTRPRIVEQEPFGSVAAALSMATPIREWSDVGDRGLCLSRAGLLLGDAPAYPVAFSLMTGAALSYPSGSNPSAQAQAIWAKDPYGDDYEDRTGHEYGKGPVKKKRGRPKPKKRRKRRGAAMATDASGHEHGEGGRFAPGRAAHARTDIAIATHRSIGKSVASDLYSNSARAKKAGEAGDHKKAMKLHGAVANAHRKIANKLADRRVARIHEEAAEHHEEAAAHHEMADDMGLSISTDAAFGGHPLPKKGPPQRDEPQDNDSDDDGISDDLDLDSEGADEDEDGLPDSLEGEDSDIGMEELLCDLLGALGIHLEHGGDPDQFKRELYNAAMTKIHELTGKVQSSQDPNKPNRTNPPGQPPNNPKPGQPGQPNPIIQQEQQPMYMSLDDINKISDPTMKNIALSMYSENAKLRAEADADRKKLNALNATKLREEDARRRSRVALLGKVSPGAKAELDAMMALPEMALSIGDDGQVVDPMAKTLAVLEKGLRDIPKLLTTPQSALSVAEQPKDADMLSEEKQDEIADGFARQMGCPPVAKAS